MLLKCRWRAGKLSHKSDCNKLQELEGSPAVPEKRDSEMLWNLGLVLLTAAEPKTGQSQTGMGSFWGVEEEKEEEEEAGGFTVVCNEASPFSYDETVMSSCPKRRMDYLSLKGSPSTGRNSPGMGRNSLSMSVSGFPCALTAQMCIGWSRGCGRMKSFSFGSVAAERGWGIAQAGGVGEHRPAPLNPQDHLSQLHIHTLPTLLCLEETSEAAEHICGVTTGLLSHFWCLLGSFSILPASGQVLLENSILVCCYTEENYEIFT